MYDIEFHNSQLITKIFTTNNISLRIKYYILNDKTADDFYQKSYIFNFFFAEKRKKLKKRN